MNIVLATKILTQFKAIGVEEVVICPGSRNAPFVQLIDGSSEFNAYWWPEERSAAFFALGLVKKNHKAVAIITTSGTAAAEMLPAAVEAYYTGLPLILLTCDRPRRFRGSGAPQAIEQLSLYGCYAPFAIDVEGDDAINLSMWDKKEPAHINVCLEEPARDCIPVFKNLPVEHAVLCGSNTKAISVENLQRDICKFFEKIRSPLVIVSDLLENEQEHVRRFLIQLKAPVVLECTSGLRGDKALQEFEMQRADIVWEIAKTSGYHIDGILRIGGIPTQRCWRDLEDIKQQLKVLSISRLPFCGLSNHRELIQTTSLRFLDQVRLPGSMKFACSNMLQLDQFYARELEEALLAEPLSEPAWMRRLSMEIADDSLIYLGNSLPIRQWDLAANRCFNYAQVCASRGANGIDGQISTFLGMAQNKQANWGIFGDLTTLYDMAGFWGLQQLPQKVVNIVVINNGGGKIFDKMFKNPAFINRHQIDFTHLAALWGINYCRWDRINCPDRISATHSFIEIVPDEAATKRFWQSIAIKTNCLV